MDQKECFKCKMILPLTEFYPHKQMGDGHLNKCKSCAKKDSHSRFLKKLKDPEWLLKERERQRKKESRRRSEGFCKKYLKRPEYLKRYRLNNPLKYKAHVSVRRALVKGDLIRGNCVICNNELTQAHHEDYNKPLEVIWYCAKHHSERHIEIREELLKKCF